MAPPAQHPDGGWGWVVVVAAFLVNFIMDGVRYSFGLLYLEWLAAFPGSRAAVGWIGGIMFGLLLIAAPVAGVLVTRFGCRVVMVIGSATTSLAFLLGSFTTSLPLLCATVGVMGGLGFSMMFITYYVALIQYFDKWRSLAIGLAVSGAGLGGFAFNPLTNYLLVQYTWRGTLLLLSGIVLHVVACGLVMRPVDLVKNATTGVGETELFVEGHQLQETCEKIHTKLSPLANKVNYGNEEMSISDGTKNHNQMKTGNRNGKSLMSKIFNFSLLSNKKFLIFVFVEIFINVSYMVPFIYAPEMALMNIQGTGRLEVVWLANAMSLANVASRVPVGLIADWLKARTVQLMALLCLVAGLSCMVMPFCRLYGLLLTACCFYAIGIVSAMVLLPVVLSKLFGDEFITDSFGISLFFGGSSGLLGVPFAGWLVDLTSSYTITFVLAGAEFIIGGALLFLVPHVKP